MSPAPRSKSKDGIFGQEASKRSLKQPANHAVSGHDPYSGTLHLFETVPVPSPSLNPDDNTSWTGVDYDSGSNYGSSWSGESEDHHKEKPSQSLPRQGRNRRDKIRQQNEKKHQRQKEKRAKELHERCCSILMSRKLEALTQQLVAMGFPQERATMALILNEGSVEESVTWILEGNNNCKEHDLDFSAMLKIDVSEELNHITDMETRYKSSKQEVERLVVSCAGDLDKVEETLRPQEEILDTPSKSEEPGSPPTIANKKQVKLGTASSANTLQKSDKKVPTQDVATKSMHMLEKPATQDVATKSMHMLEKPTHIRDMLARPRANDAPVKKRWVIKRSNPTSSFSLASSSSVAQTEPQYSSIPNNLKNLQLGSPEPAILTQPAHTTTTKQVPSASDGLYLPGLACYRPLNSHKTCAFVPPVSTSSSCPQYRDLHCADPYSSQRIAQGNDSLTSASPGLFSGLPGTSSSNGWNLCSSSPQIHYSNVDWSMDRGLFPSALSTSGGANYSTIQSTVHGHDSVGLGAMVNSRQHDAFGRDMVANSRQLDILGPGAMANTRQLDAFGPGTIANLRQLDAFGCCTMASSRRVHAFSIGAMANSRQLEAFGLGAMANSRQLVNVAADAVVDWTLAYEDISGRSTREILPKQHHHGPSSTNNENPNTIPLSERRQSNVSSRHRPALREKAEQRVIETLAETNAAEIPVQS